MLVANRELRLLNASGDVKIAVRIFAPELEADGAWACRYEVDWPDQKTAKTTYGFDSMQSLVLALQMIGAEIYSSSYHDQGMLFWDSPRKGYGFPVMSSYRDLLQGDDAKYL
jgi:hypothetical protein